MWPSPCSRTRSRREAALIALILTFGPVSGAHFNPAVSFADASQGGLTWRDAGRYAVSQCAGGLVGVAAANVMFDEPVFAWSRHVRAAGGDLGVLPTTIVRRAVRGRRLHHGGVLVYGINFVRQSGRDGRPGVH